MVGRLAIIAAISALVTFNPLFCARPSQLRTAARFTRETERATVGPAETVYGAKTHAYGAV